MNDAWNNRNFNFYWNAHWGLEIATTVNGKFYEILVHTTSEPVGSNGITVYRDGAGIMDFIPV